MNTVYWDETPPDSLNRLLHQVIFGRNPDRECHGHFEPDGWDDLYYDYRCPFCLYRTHVPTNQQALTSLYLAPHFYVPDYIGSYEGAELIFRSMRTERETREPFHQKLQELFSIPIKPNTDVISALSLAFSLGPELFQLVAIAALETCGYQVVRGNRKRRIA